MPAHSKLSFPVKNSTLLFVAMPLISLLLAYSIKIQQVVCFVEGEPELEVCGQLDYLLHQSIFFTNLENTPLFQSTLVNQCGQVFLPHRVEKHLPTTLVVYFLPENPVFILELADGSRFVVNSRHHLIADQDQFELPVVVIGESHQAKIDEDKLEIEFFEKLSGLITALSAQDLGFMKVFVKEKYGVIVVEQVEYIFELDEDPFLLAARIKAVAGDMDAIIKKLNTGERLRQIDMRFQLPIINPKVIDY